MELFEKDYNSNIFVTGFGIVPPMKNDQDFGLEEIFQPNQEVVSNLKNLTKVANSLKIQSVLYTKQNILTSCPFKGIQGYEDDLELFRTLHVFNVSFDNGKALALTDAICAQYEKTFSVPPPENVFGKSSKNEFTSIDGMQELVDKIGCVIIFLSGKSLCPIQTLIPKRILQNCPLFIGIGKECFFETEEIPDSTEVNPKTNEDRCYCGRNTNRISCNTSNCPCFKSRRKCWENPECRCSNCGNKWGHRKNSEPASKKRCQCKNGCEENSRCPCVKAGHGCGENPR